MESPFKTPSKVLPFQMLPSSGSSSPFTPKRSRIKKKINGECCSVSRILAFDDSNSRSPFNRKLEFSSLSQQANIITDISIPSELEHIKSEQTTPIKTEEPPIDKNAVLISPSIRKRPNRFNLTSQEKNSIKPSPSKRSSSNNSTPSKKFKSNIIESCKPITHYFKPSQKRLDFATNKVDTNFPTNQLESNEENVQPKTEHCFSKFFTAKNNQKLNLKNENNTSLEKNGNEVQVTLKESKNINSNQSSIKPESLSFKNVNKKTSPKKDVENSPNKNQLIKGVIKQITPSKNEYINNTVLTSPKITDLLENKVIISGGDTYSRFIKLIVLKIEMFCLGKEDIMTKIENCTDDELKIYGRLFARKHGWIRLDGPDGLKKYKEQNLCNNFDSILASLVTKQLINSDVTSCELDCLLNILKSQELKELQKTFNINLSSSKNKTKPEMIKSFVNLVKNQRTFCGNSISNLKERAKKMIGDCYKLSDNSRDDIISCLIYESYPYFNGEEKDRFRDCFTKFSLVERNELKFPNFETQRVSLNFSSKDSLEMYKIALNLRHEVQLSLEQKDHENAITMLKIVFEKFKSAVNDKYIIDSLSKIPTYMRKYSAISVFAHTLFKNITILKKSTTDEDLAKNVLEFLLKHKEFSMSKRADLHIELAKVFETQYKQLNTAAKVIIDGLKDETMNELGHQMLSNRAVLYINRKIRKLDDKLKEELLSLITITKKQLPSTTINGQIISVREKVSSGRKQVYSKKTENGDILYMSVEELALSHYKSLGYLNGIHDEGQLIKSMFLLCFWDIIYDSYPQYVLFISRYQDCPLDWRTRHFYHIREQKIKDRLAELKQMNVDQICDLLKTRYDEYFGTQSVINWKSINEHLPECKIILECVGIGLFLAIGDQILKDGRIYLHGMPDLVVWDAVRHKCIFVEVKGPKDKLSERQHSWLLKLIEFGANVEVCHVVGTGGKNSKENMD